MPVAARLPLLVAGMLCLAFGIAAGLARLGFDIGAPAALHGPLLGGAFFGTVIGLERAVALARPWAFLAPLLAACGGLAWMFGAPAPAGGLLLAAGGLVLLAASLLVLKRQPELHLACLAAGAACLPLGAAVVAAGDPSAATPAWLGFLVLTIAGERLELNRLLPPSPAARRAFTAIACAFLGAVVLAVFAPNAGWKLVALAALALAAWLALKDIARRTVREKGLTRFIACALLASYFWLAAGAVFALADPQFGPGRASWDAALHAWFLGFVFSMVFGHAPIIAPALLKVALRYHWSFYAPLALLHLSLAERIAGDLLLMPAMRERGAAANAAAIVLFLATMAASGLARRSAVHR